ncbi:TolC family protein [Roseomonas sp. SSH11]|uniref:TolC family protein n=1 Tax=Pararoseomonas baculiformis TaxID=2820812 RepID=A0ABS4AIW0_9PROT|nr:TolC family protein [Pararoseomonas baculiformis]MBP0446794.1 TolC family protein [Pararoseomonas baculiformis]
MTHTIRPLLLGALLLAAGGAAAQPRPEPPRLATTQPLPANALTLAEAEALMVERNLSLLAARRGVDIARAQLLVADTRPAPELGYSQTVGQIAEGQRFRNVQGARGYSPVQNASITLSVLVERGGKRELRTRLAEAQVTVAEAQLLDALRGQIYSLRQAFLNGLQARADLDVALANRTALDRTEALLRRQVREGQVPEVDLLRFQASRLPFAQELAAAAQSYAAASAQVAALLGADATRVAERRAPAGDPMAALLAPVPLELRGRLDVAPAAPPAREALAEALPNRPDVLAASRGVGAAAANTRLSEAARTRDVTLNGGVTRSEIATDLSGGARGITSLGLGATLPIFTARITEANVAVAVAQQGQAAAQASSALAAAQADLATAWAGYRQARALVDLTAGQVLRRAEEAYSSTEAAYRAGGRTLLDVLDALRTLNATRVSANAARAQLLLSLAQLEQASGVAGIAPRL